MRPIVISLLLAGCSEYDIKPGGHAVDDGVPDIELSTTAMAFGPVDGGAQDVQLLTISNVGQAPLTVKDLVITAGEDSFSVLTSPTEMVIDIDGSAEVEIAFTPFLATNFGVLEVRSDDPDEATLNVDLLGEGNVPQLALDPVDFSFPSGCEDTVYVKIQNVGTADLVVNSLSYLGDAELSLESMVGLPLTLAPGAESGVIVRYVPAENTVSTGALTAVSNDPRGNQQATQLGQPVLGTINETFESLGDPPIDIVFALDKSGSMTDEMGALANAFDDFIVEINNVTTDWRIGVVSHQNGCFNNGIITPATPNYEATFRDAVRGLQILGTDLTEALLQLTTVALWETVPGGCNEGFARADAVLHIVAVSDEPDQSDQPWDYYVNGFKAAKADPNLVVVSSVIDLFNSCGSGGDGYIQASDDTGGLKLNICTSNWGAYAADLSAASIAALHTFYLSAIPEDGTIVVSSGGVVYTTGWHYDATLNAVVIDDELPAGIQIDVEYQAIGC